MTTNMHFRDTMPLYLKLDGIENGIAANSELQFYVNQIIQIGWDMDARIGTVKIEGEEKEQSWVMAIQVAEERNIEFIERLASDIFPDLTVSQALLVKVFGRPQPILDAKGVDHIMVFPGVKIVLGELS